MAGCVTGLDCCLPLYEVNIQVHWQIESHKVRVEFTIHSLMHDSAGSTSCLQTGQDAMPSKQRERYLEVLLVLFFILHTQVVHQLQRSPLHILGGVRQRTERIGHEARMVVNALPQSQHPVSQHVHKFQPDLAAISYECIVSSMLSQDHNQILH